MTAQSSSPLNDAFKRLMNRLLGWIPNWVGFGIIIVIGILAIIAGATAAPASAGLIAFGIAAIISAILAWATGASSRPDWVGGSFGATVGDLKGWVWLVIFVLFLIAVIIAVAVR